MSDLSPEDIEKARNAAQRLGRNAGITLMALQQVSTGTPVTALAATLIALRDAAGELLAADPRIAVAYDPQRDEAALRLLSESPTYVESSLAELESDWTATDRKALSALLHKWLFSDVFPAPMDTADPLVRSVQTVINTLEGTDGLGGL